MTVLKRDVGNPILNSLSKTEYTTFTAKNKTIGCRVTTMALFFIFFYQVIAVSRPLFGLLNNEKMDNESLLFECKMH